MTATAVTRPHRAPAGIEVRPLEPGEAAAVLAVFAGMGPRSRELRFLTHKPRLTGAELKRLTAVDQRDHVALVASTTPDHQPIGIARFVRADDAAESAEVAVAVVDSWQRQGVGTLLLEALVRRARNLGVRRFTALASHDNRGALRLLHRFPDGPSRVGIGGGAAEYAVSLEGAEP